MPDPANRPTLLVAALGHRLHGLAAPAAAAVPWPWRPPAASNPRSGPAVRRGAGATMLRGCWLPATENWVPLLVMSLTVGLFEAVFSRGFIQGRLQASLGTGPAVAGAAALYALYHVGYGMGLGDMGFLLALGVVYAIAYRLVESVLVLWPLLTPLGGWFSYLEGGDFQLPWASIAGFADVLGLMALVIWLAYKRQRRRALAQGG